METVAQVVRAGVVSHIRAVHELEVDAVALAQTSFFWIVIRRALQR